MLAISESNELIAIFVKSVETAQKNAQKPSAKPVVRDAEPS